MTRQRVGYGGLPLKYPLVSSQNYATNTISQPIINPVYFCHLMRHYPMPASTDSSYTAVRALAPLGKNLPRPSSGNPPIWAISHNLSAIKSTAPHSSTHHPWYIKGGRNRSHCETRMAVEIIKLEYRVENISPLENLSLSLCSAATRHQERWRGVRNRAVVVPVAVAAGTAPPIVYRAGASDESGDFASPLFLICF